MKKEKKTIKKKSFYFEDYTESEFIKKDNNNLVKVLPNRLTFLSFIFFSVLLIFGFKIIYLSLSPEKFSSYNNIKKDFSKNRRDIVDRNGAILATNVILYDVGIRPKLLSEKEKKKLLIKLALLSPELDLENIKKKIK